MGKKQTVIERLNDIGILYDIGKFNNIKIPLSTRLSIIKLRNLIEEAYSEGRIKGREETIKLILKN